MELAGTELQARGRISLADLAVRRQGALAEAEEALRKSLELERKAEKSVF